MSGLTGTEEVDALDKFTVAVIACSLEGQDDQVRQPKQQLAAHRADSQERRRGGQARPEAA